ncbi:ATP-dependent helicase [Ceratobasidium theobromae]|uniref:ATP-dependent helicase n=1 Tax=Ceratobasidium theobromae TaxID=1582974 RepID=A0A5N5QDV4_9AGAM|nr:ATP-dependent helicase [Ceratobasidium theobromae]
MGEISVRDAAKALGLSGPGARLPGMQVALMSHQLIGVAWMVKQELGDMAGGILAKTIQTIALIIKNRPKEHNSCKGTLVVAPAALVDQWNQEIIHRTADNLFKIHVHHGKDKLRSASDVRKFDTLTNEFPADEAATRKKKKVNKGGLDHFIVDSSDDERSRKRTRRARKYGPLAANKWYRVVVDEAQNIRNRSSRSSRIMATLDAKYRWALTGTPVTNSLADLYGILRYLHVSPYDDWTRFNEHIVKVQKRDAKLAGQRAKALLEECLLRRTKDSQLEGKPLITLPPKTIDIVELEFSPDERRIYAAVEMRQQEILTTFIREGTVMKNYSAILVMILRLRQVCNHPKLIAYTSAKFSEVNALRTTAYGGGGLGIKSWPSSTLSATRVREIMGVENFASAMRQFRETTEQMIRAELTGENIPNNHTTECPVCFDGCVNDIFKQALQGEAAANDQFGTGRQFSGKEVRPCPECGNELTTSHIFPATIFEPTDQEKGEIKYYIESELGRSKATNLKPIFADSDGDNDTVRIIDENPDVEPIGIDEGEESTSSTKILQLLRLLKAWRKEAPEDKIICYSQCEEIFHAFRADSYSDIILAQGTSMIDLMQIVLHQNGYESLRYDGQMNREKREGVLSRFKQHNGPKVILISLKCGGVGLNLTEANRIICMDPAWNAATERQAIDRVHRLVPGQLKSVVVKRLVVKGTIEERILKIQAEKQNLSDMALGEGSGSKTSHMNVEKLKKFVKHDEAPGKEQTRKEAIAHAKQEHWERAVKWRKVVQIPIKRNKGQLKEWRLDCAACKIEQDLAKLEKHKPEWEKPTKLKAQKASPKPVLQLPGFSSGSEDESDEE